MTRRGMTLAVSTALLILLAVVVGAMSVPYVALTPGPVTNTLGRTGDGEPIIQVTGKKTYPADGRLDLTTVGVRGAPGYSPLSLVEALRFWLDPKVAVVPRESQYPPDKDADEIQAETTQQMVDSQQAAALAALRQLGEPVSSLLVVAEVTKGGPSDGVLKAEDRIESVDGKPVRSARELRDQVGPREPGTPVTIGYTRAGKKMSSTIRTVVNPDDPSRAALMILLTEQCPCDTPYDVEIGLADDVGGPSAGLMFALAIIDTVTPGELTGGVHIAGTGTIDPAGRVGPIGGIQQKLHGARDEGARHFLVPADNWDEANRTPPSGLQLHRVETLGDAVTAVCGISKATGPPCGT